jgi:hypothetical protein
MIHHENKDAEEGANLMQVLRGTGAIAAGAGAVWRVHRREDGGRPRLIHLRSAGYQDLQKTFSLERRGGGLGDDSAELVWANPDGALEAFEMEQGLDAVVEIVRNHPGINNNNICNELGGRKSRAKQVIEEAVKLQLIWQLLDGQSHLYYPKEPLELVFAALPGNPDGIASSTSIPRARVKGLLARLLAQQRVTDLGVAPDGTRDWWQVRK